MAFRPAARERGSRLPPSSAALEIGLPLSGEPGAAGRTCTRVIADGFLAHRAVEGRWSSRRNGRRSSGWPAGQPSSSNPTTRLSHFM
jgi:hypothetical protein